MKIILITLGIALYSFSAYSSESNCDTMKQHLLETMDDVHTAYVNLKVAEENEERTDHIMMNLENTLDTALANMAMAAKYKSIDAVVNIIAAEKDINNELDKAATRVETAGENLDEAREKMYKAENNLKLAVANFQKNCEKQ